MLRIILGVLIASAISGMEGVSMIIQVLLAILSLALVINGFNSYKKIKTKNGF